MKVFTIDPGRFDPLTAYAAVNTLRLDDMNPHIYRTHDGGKTWKEIVNGIPGGAPVSVVREDPKRKGLLFAGSETQVYVSFDDGDHWQSLRLNMAPSSVRDLVVKDDDLVVGTHGRGIWILDDITPLRQIDATTADAGRRAVQAAGRLARPVEHEHRHAAAARRADGAESARGRDHQLLPEVRGVRTGDARDHRRRRQARAPLFERRRSLQARSGDDRRAALLVPRRSRRSRPRRDAPLHLGPALPAARRAGRRRPARSAARRCRSPRSAHNTVPAPTTPWVNPGTFTVKLTVNGKTLHAADRGQAGSAREDAAAGDAAGLLAVEGGILRRGRRAGGGDARCAALPTSSRSCGRR